MQRGVHAFAHRAMTTTFEVRIDSEDTAYAAGAAQAVFARYDEIERALTRYDAGSDVSRVNRAPVGEWVRVSPDLQQCLLRAQEIHRSTGGVFDPSYRKPAGFSVLTVDTQTPRARPGAPVDLDLGGIGKGYALDQAAALLHEWDLKRALLHAGGSTVLALAPPRGKPGWRVNAEGMHSLVLEDRSLSASGTAVRGNHITDPRTGEPPTDTQRVWTSAPAATESDALSTAFFLMKPDAIRAYCKRHPEIGAQWMEDGETRQAGDWPG